MTTDTLLLAEDEAFIQELLASVLAEAGFQIVLASDGTQALRELDMDAVRFSGIITDIRLGAGPDGWEVGRRARSLLPHVPIIYISGDSAHHWAVKGAPGSLFIAKPFRCSQVVATLSTRLAVTRFLARGRAPVVSRQGRLPKRRSVGPIGTLPGLAQASVCPNQRRRCQWFIAFSGP